MRLLWERMSFYALCSSLGHVQEENRPVQSSYLFKSCDDYDADADADAMLQLLLIMMMMMWMMMILSPGPHGGGEVLWKETIGVVDVD